MKKLGILLCACLLFGCSGKAPEQNEPQKETPPVEDVSVSFLAVGDNLIHNSLYLDPAAKANGTYNFEHLYANIKDMVQSVDIANINQETPIAGAELELSNYPMFNGPHEIADALVNTGFDWVTHATNHALDRGEAGIISQMNYWDQFSEMITTGINRSQEEEARQRIIERKGIRFGLLNYTYGTNGIEEPQGKEYLVNQIDKEKIKQDIAALKPNCDQMIVEMHWGQEYQMQPNEEQQELAQFLSDLGVQVIIASHPHVIQPVELLTGKNGNQTLVIYSLGNFTSAQDQPDTMLGGLMKWEVVKSGKTGEYHLDQMEYYPLVTYYDKAMANFTTYPLKDYSEEIATTHYLAPLVSRQYMVDLAVSVMGERDFLNIIYE